MRIDFQGAPESFRRGRVVAFVHRFRGMFEIGVKLDFCGIWYRWVRLPSRLSRHTIHDQQPHYTGSRDPPGEHSHSHTPNFNALARDRSKDGVGSPLRATKPTESEALQSLDSIPTATVAPTFLLRWK